MSLSVACFCLAIFRVIFTPVRSVRAGSLKASTLRVDFGDIKARELTACATKRTELTANADYKSCSWSLNGNSQGSVLYTITAITLKLTSCTAKNCYSSQAGGFLYVTDATVTFTTCTFTSCRASGDYPGGVVYQGINTDLTATKCNFTSCYAMKGGGCFEVAYPGKLTVKGWPSVFNKCYAASASGGVIRDLSYSAGATVNASSLTVTACDARGSSSGGGFLWSYMGTSTVTSCTFKNCWTTGGGGAVYQMTKTSKMTMTSCTMQNCSANTRQEAHYGGGAFCMHAGTFEMSKCTMKNCYTIGNGGAIALTEAKDVFTVTVNNCTITNCSSTNAYGGGLWANGTQSSLTVKSLIASQCTAKNAQGIVIYIQTKLKTMSLTNLCIRGSGHLVYAASSPPATPRWIDWCNIPVTAAYDVLPSKEYMRMRKLLIDGFCYFVCL